MARTKSKQLASLLTFTTASIDVVSGSLIPDAANLYNVGSSTLPYNSGSFQNLDVSSTGQVKITNLFVSDFSRFTGSVDVSGSFDNFQPTQNLCSPCAFHRFIRKTCVSFALSICSYAKPMFSLVFHRCRRKTLFST